MKASIKSIHAKLYHFTYWHELPSNLCPYFWKLVWATIIFIPNLIIQIPSLVVMIFNKNHGMYDCSERREVSGVIYFGLLILFIYVFASIHWFKAMFDFYSYDQVLANVGWIFNFIIAIGVCVWIIKEKKPFRKNIKIGIREEKKPSIIIEFIKAKYNKYCPKIDWE